MTDEDLEALEMLLTEKKAAARKFAEGSNDIDACRDADEALADEVPRLLAEVRRQAEEIDHIRYLHSRALDAAKAAAGHLAGHRRSKTGSKEEFAARSVDEVVEILTPR